MTDHPQPRSAGAVRWSDASGVLFDLDGVITPTADIHQRVWAELFADYGFTAADYLTYVDGKPRYDGVASYLSSQHVELPWGDPDDAPGDTTVCAMGNRKNELFNKVLERDGVAPYRGSVAVIDVLDRAQVPSAIVSSSRNARSVLTAAGLIDRFPVIVDGVTAAAEDLSGKPAPDMFARGAELLGVDADGVIAVEDATAGVAAAAACGFALVLGVDRGGNRQSLIDAGADLVVEDLAETLPGGATTEGRIP